MSKEQAGAKTAEQRIAAFSGGKQKITIGDKFKWNGMCPGQYEVVEFVDENVVYSPSRLGGTFGVIVKNIANGATDEWCADSVANGIFHNKID